MADHVRRQLREAVAVAVTGLVTTAARVFQSRVYPVQTAELPGLLVHTDAETDEQQLDLSYRREVDVVIEAKARATADLDDLLDEMAKEVETALANGVTLGGRNVPLPLVGIVVERSDEGEQPTGTLTLTYQPTLYSAPGQPDVLL